MLQQAAVSLFMAFLSARLGSGGLFAGLEGLGRHLFCALLVVAAVAGGESPA